MLDPNKVEHVTKQQIGTSTYEFLDEYLYTEDEYKQCDAESRIRGESQDFTISVYAALAVLLNKHDLTSPTDDIRLCNDQERSFGQIYYFGRYIEVALTNLDPKLKQHLNIKLNWSGGVIDVNCIPEWICHVIKSDLNSIWVMGFINTNDVKEQLYDKFDNGLIHVADHVADGKKLIARSFHGKWVLNMRYEPYTYPLLTIPRVNNYGRQRTCLRDFARKYGQKPKEILKPESKSATPITSPKVAVFQDIIHRKDNMTNSLYEKILNEERNKARDSFIDDMRARAREQARKEIELEFGITPKAESLPEATTVDPEVKTNGKTIDLETVKKGLESIREAFGIGLADKIENEAFRPRKSKALLMVKKEFRGMKPGDPLPGVISPTAKLGSCAKRDGYFIPQIGIINPQSTDGQTLVCVTAIKCNTEAEAKEYARRLTLQAYNAGVCNIAKEIS